MRPIRASVLLPAIAAMTGCQAVSVIWSEGPWVPLVAIGVAIALVGYLIGKMRDR